MRLVRREIACHNGRFASTHTHSLDFGRLEDELHALVSSPHDAGRRRALGATVEYVLCELVCSQPETARYWIDGVIIERIDFAPEGRLRVEGVAWCAEHRSQWQVPVEMLAELSGRTVSALTFRLGDARLPDLRAQSGRRLRSWPTEWLHEFEVQRPSAPPPVDARKLEERLLEWASSNPSRPIVGAGWEPLTIEEALQFIRSRVEAGEDVGLEETWLEGGPALIVT